VSVPADNGASYRRQLEQSLTAVAAVLSNNSYLACGSSEHENKRIYVVSGNKNGSSYSMAECRVPELIPVLGSRPADDVSHKSGGRLPLLSTRPTVTPATLKRAATSFSAW